MSADQVVPWPIMLDDVRHLEELGIETVWLADHYGWAPVPTLPILEQWTTLAALAGGTKRVRLGTLISNVAVRHPAMLAKQAATVDVSPVGGSISASAQASPSVSTHGWVFPSLVRGAASTVYEKRWRWSTVCCEIGISATTERTTTWMTRRSCPHLSSSRARPW
jgi:hypothetical protein